VSALSLHTKQKTSNIFLETVSTNHGELGFSDQPPEAARTIAALLALRDQVIAPILAGMRSPRRGRKPAHWTTVDRDYETLPIAMQNLFHDLGITPIAAARRIGSNLSIGEMQAPRQAPPDTAEVCGSAGEPVRVGAGFPL
jgi:hypothetical protein